MSISLDQAYQIFMADRETSCADKTLIYYRENLTGFFTYVSECFNRPVFEISCDEVTRELFRNYICTCGSVRSSRTILSWNRPRNCFRLPASGHMPGQSRYLPISVRITNTVMTLLTR